MTGDYLKSMREYALKEFKSFKAAFRGFILILESEPHARFHLAATVSVVTAGIMFRVSAGQWCILLICIAMVWITEIINSSIEKLCDLVQPQWDSKIGNIKDTAASAVLVAAIIAVILGIIIFYRYL